MPCDLPAADLPILLEAAGFGESLDGHGTLLADVVGAEVVIWTLAGGVERLVPEPYKREGAVLSWGLDPAAQVNLSVGPPGVAIGLPELDNGGAVVAAVVGDKEIETVATPGDRDEVGAPVGWIDGFRDSAEPHVATVSGSGRTELLVATEAGFVAGPRLSNGSTIVRGVFDGERHTLAVRYRSGGGSVRFFVGPQVTAGMAYAGTVRGEQGMNLGARLALVDLDGDGSLDLVATTLEGVAAWSGPIEGEQGLDQAWWRHAELGVTTDLAVGDFNGDGNPDVAVAAADADDAGAVWVFTSAANRAAGRDAPRLTVTGARLGDRLGASIAFVDVDDDGIDDLVVGAPGASRILVVPGQAAW
jgi:hypothetical protein